MIELLKRGESVLLLMICCEHTIDCEIKLKEECRAGDQQGSRDTQDTQEAQALRRRRGRRSCAGHAQSTQGHTGPYSTCPLAFQ